MPEEKNLILEARHVTRRFPAPGGGARTACDDVSLKFYRGETLGLIEESGCGKSTLMRLLVRLDVPDEGEILYQGKDLARMKGEALRQARQHIQMVFQDPGGSFHPRMKIRDMVCEPLLNFGRIRPTERTLPRGSCWKRWGCLPRLPTGSRTSCPAGSSKGLRLPVRLRSSRR